MRLVDLIGYLASALVVLTFYMNDMISLRMAALASNCAFLTYGAGLGLGPVVVLHGILLPLNCWRLAQAVRSERKSNIFTAVRKHLAGRLSLREDAGLK